MRFSSLLWVIGIGLILPFKLGHAATHTHTDSDDSYHITGDITSEDISKAKAILEKPRDAKRIILHVILDSHGGDMNAAMEIGKLIRKANAATMIPFKAKCYGACVLAFSGGITKNPFGELGITRPQLSGIKDTSYDSVRSKLQKQNQAIEAYLAEMNISPALFPAMTSLPATETRMLTESEIAQFGLKGVDPVRREIVDDSWATNLKISRHELYTRRNKADQVCGHGNPDDRDSLRRSMECRDRVLKTGK